MNAVDYLIVGVLLVIVGLAAFAVWRNKKKGKKCIGCPDSGCCSGHCAGCSGNCGQCSGK